MEFKLTLQDKCFHNEITLDQDLNDAVYHIAIADTMTITPIYTDSIVGCTAVKQLFFYDNAGSEWIECDSDCIANTADSDYPFVSSFNTETGILQLLTTDIETYDSDDAPASVFKTKITLTDTVSNHTVVDEFFLTLNNKCSGNILSLVDDLTDITYIMNSGDSTPIQTTVGMTVNDASCILSYTLQFKNTVSDQWENYNPTNHPYVSSWSALTGILII